MLYTLTDARNKVKPYVGGGSTNNTLLDARINDALERLLDNKDWECLRRPVRIIAVGNTFALPHNAEKILWCDLDGTPALVFGQGYQYLSSGPGDLDITKRHNGLRDLVDLGDSWATEYDIPRAFSVSSSETWSVGEMNLLAFAESARDVGKAISVFGAGVDGLERLNGETLVLQSRGSVAAGTWDDSFEKTTLAYSVVGRVNKPVTDGYVSLYAVEPTSENMFLLARYHPSQTIPQFRRYRVTNSTVADTGVQSASSNPNTGFHNDIVPAVTSGSRSVVLALVRLRHVPLSDPGDLVPLNSMQALLFAVRSIDAEVDKKDFALADTLMDKALTLMDKREETNVMTKGTPVIMDMNYRMSMGRRVNRRMIM